MTSLCTCDAVHITMTVQALQNCRMRSNWTDMMRARGAHHDTALLQGNTSNAVKSVLECTGLPI